MGSSGDLEVRSPLDVLGVVPIVTTRIMGISDMDWNDISRVSKRAVERPNLYIPRLGEYKIIDFGGFDVMARLVGIGKSVGEDGKAIGFTFQLSDGLPAMPYGDPEDLIDMLPDDLASHICETGRGRLWYPSVDNVMGTGDLLDWYDWYQFHNTADERRMLDSSGEFLGYWTSTETDSGVVVVNRSGKRSTVRVDGEYLPDICFAIG